MGLISDSSSFSSFLPSLMCSSDFCNTPNWHTKSKRLCHGASCSLLFTLSIALRAIFWGQPSILGLTTALSKFTRLSGITLSGLYRLRSSLVSSCPNTRRRLRRRRLKNQRKPNEQLTTRLTNKYLKGGKQILFAKFSIKRAKNSLTIVILSN